MSQRALGQRQFQPTLPGMEHLAAPAAPEKGLGRPRTSETVHKVLGATPPGKPAGMRGSIPHRAEMADRLGRQIQNRGRWESLRIRVDDERHTEYGDDEDTMPVRPHPRTGLPSYGEASTHDDIGMARSAVPHGLSFHGSAASARNKVGKAEMIPLYNMRQPYAKQMIGTVQDRVSSRRVHEAMEHPETTRSPRFHGPGMEELPHVYKRSLGTYGEEHTVVDGNHRTASHILQGRLFMQARTVSDADIPEVQRRTKKTQGAIDRALSDPGRAARHEKRHNDLIFGAGNW